MNIPWSLIPAAASLALATSLIAAESLIPLTEFPPDHSYHGESGGLYGAAGNLPPPPLLESAMAQARRVQPLDPQGRPSPKGRIGLAAIGMSNTAREFSEFQRKARADASHNPLITLVNGAQGGMDSGDWADPGTRLRQDQPSPWDQLLQRVKSAHLTAAQVQVLWISHARRKPEALGSFPAHARTLEQDLRAITAEAERRFPNLRLVYFSSRNYAGYAKIRLNPEPFAYESAFAVRQVVVDTANGRGEQPVRLWGPYPWSAGTTPRADGLTWLPGDFEAADGTHPSNAGAAKIARLLLDFFRNDPTSRRWWNARSTPEN